MVEAGLLDLDKDVNTYLTSWKLADNDHTKENPVTLRALLSHTGGTTVSGFRGYANDGSIPSLVEVLNGTNDANSDKVEVDKAPGLSYRYSGGGTTIIQQALIDQLKKPFEEIMKKWVLDPLGMDCSFFRNEKLTEEQTHQIALGHDVHGKAIQGGYHVYPEMAATGLWTKPEDMAKFIIGVQGSLEGGKEALLSKNLAEEMITPLLAGAYSLGFEHYSHAGDQMIGHSGSNMGYKCGIEFHRSKGFGIVLMTNGDMGYGMKLPFLRSVAVANGWSGLVSGDYTLQEASDEVIGLFTGRYRIDVDTSLEVYVQEDVLCCEQVGEKTRRFDYVGECTFVSQDREVMLTYDPVSQELMVDGEKLDPLAENELLALDYVKMGKPDLVLATYGKLLQDNPAIGSGLDRKLGGLAMGLGKEGNPRLAASIMEVVLGLYPDSAIGWDMMGRFRFDLEEFDLAVEALERALELNPKLSGSQVLLDQAKGKVNE